MAAFASIGIDGRLYYSLSGSPGLTLDMLAPLRERERQGRRIAIVAQINKRLPFMYHDAMVETSVFDLVLRVMDFVNQAGTTFACPSRTL